ncbi:MAG: alanine racemase [Candidatus Gracilibacteria bacterium]|jgi:alanine racemase
MKELTWVEISKKALENNIHQFRKLIGEKRILCPCVKANAYGHGLVEAAKIFLESGADWLSVNSVYEVRALRKSGVKAPILILGYVPLEALGEALELDAGFVVYNRETVERLNKEASQLGKKAKIHIKIETGNNRQGVLIEELSDFAKYAQSFGNVEIEGMSTHFANIEDTTDHSYAMAQIEKFLKAEAILKEIGIGNLIKHCANSAATILFPETHFDLVRVGIASYGMWPSKETCVSYMGKEGIGTRGGEREGERRTRKCARGCVPGEVCLGFELTPAFTWKTKIAQIKKIPAGEYIGYGCTYRTTHETRLAILPVGYYDGYDRGISNGHVLIHGKRAFLRGRVCMNIIMADVTDIPEAKLEDEVVLIGKSGDDVIPAEQFASWASTINYEVTTRVNDRIPRVVV